MGYFVPPCSPGHCLWASLVDYRPPDPLTQPLFENSWMDPLNGLHCGDIETQSQKLEVAAGPGQPSPLDVFMFV